MKKGPNKQLQSQKSMFIWLSIVIALVFLLQVNNHQKKDGIKEFSYPTFIQALNEGHIKEVTFHSSKNQISGTVIEEFKQKYKGLNFRIDADVDKAYDEVKKVGINPKYKNENHSILTMIFIQSLPILFIVLLFFFFMRQLQSTGGKALSFGKSKAKLLTEHKKRVTFKDVAGVEEAKSDLVEIVDFLKSPKKFTKLGGKIPKGVLLVGPPGTGKTLLARAVAGEAKVPFFTISGSDFVEMFVGVGASRVRDMFEQGKKNSPCLIFIDEIDAVGRHRGAGMGGGHDEREQTLNQLLVEMDGFDANEGIIIIAATNRPDVLDPALLRPGRFDRRVVVGKPDLEGRLAILKVHTKDKPLAAGVDLSIVARGTPGFSGADLANLVNESALLAARENKTQIFNSHFDRSRDKVMMGAARNIKMPEDELKNTAYHESGHAIIGRLLPQLDPVHKVTIIPHGMALGVTLTLPERDQYSYTRTKALNMLPFLFGGRAAEEIIFTDYTTGASNDIERATEIARKMVTEWGMSELVGPLAYESNSQPVFLGMQQSQSTRDYSEEKAKLIDGEVERLIKEGYKKAKELLTEHVDKLHLMAQALLEFETIDSQEVNMIINGTTIEDLRVERQKKEEQEINSYVEETESKDPSVGNDPVGSGAPV